MKENKLQKQGLSIILSELKENRAEIDETIAQLDTLHNQIKKLSKNETLEDGFSYDLLSLKNNGFETAKFTGVLNGLDYKLNSEIVQTYHNQQSILNFESRMVDELLKLMRTGESYPKESFHYFLIIINDLKENLKSIQLNLNETVEILQEQT